MSFKRTELQLAAGRSVLCTHSHNSPSFGINEGRTQDRYICHGVLWHYSQPLHFLQPVLTTFAIAPRIRVGRSRARSRVHRIEPSYGRGE